MVLGLVKVGGAGAVRMRCRDGKEGWESRMWRGCKEVGGQLRWRRMSLWTSFGLAGAQAGGRGGVAVHLVACFDFIAHRT